jgi:hypothetical protein
VRRGARAAALAAALTAVVCALCAASPAGAVAATPACTKAAARKAVVSTGLARRIKTTLGSVFRPGESVLGLFGVGQLLCADVTADGTPEMIVLLQCCTVSSPSPWAIFKVNARRRWALRYTRIRTVAFHLRVDAAGDVEAKSPHYAPSDPNCCPSSYQYVRAHWTGTAFVTLRGRG